MNIWKHLINRKATTVAIFLSLFTLLALSLTRVLAQSGTNAECTLTYQVQRGDYLYRIAEQFNITVPALIRLNAAKISNPNLIYPGQVFCVSTAPEASETQAQLALETSYAYDVNEAESAWNLASGQVGRRVVLPVQGSDAIQTFSQGAAIADTVAGGNIPNLVMIQNQNDDSSIPTSYTLVTVGADILSSLHISGTVPVTDHSGGCRETQDIHSVLGDASTQTAQMTVWLESDDGLRTPFLVTRTDAVADADTLWNCYLEPRKEDIILAYFSPDTLQMVLSHNVDGPPGPGTLAKCASWKRGGLYFAYLRRLYGCPP